MSGSTSCQQRKRTACDRCRNQKLACTYDEGAIGDPCHRCQRAGAECHHSPSLKMGRRPARERERHKSSGAVAVQTPQNPQNPHHTLSDSLQSAKKITPDAYSSCSNSKGNVCSKGTVYSPPQLTIDNVSTHAVNPSVLHAADPIAESSWGEPDNDFILPLSSASSAPTELTWESLCTEPVGQEPLFLEADMPSMLDWDMDSSADQIEAQRHLKDASEITQVNAAPIQQLAELNSRLQKLVMCGTATGSRNSWTANGQVRQDDTATPFTEHAAPESRIALANDLVQVAQILLDILERFQPQLSGGCSGCMDGYSPPRSHSHFDIESICLRPNTQTLLSIISCYVQILRLCSNFFCHVSETLAAHSLGDCISLSHLSLFAEHQLRSFPVRLTIDIQISVSVQIISHMLNSIERALGCSPTAPDEVYDIDVTEPSRGVCPGKMTQHNCNVCSQPLGSPNQNREKEYQVDAGLLGKYRSQELLETVIKLEDMESRRDGRRSIRLLREDIKKVKNML